MRTLTGRTRQSKGGQHDTGSGNEEKREEREGKSHKMETEESGGRSEDETQAISEHGNGSDGELWGQQEAVGQ